MTTTPGTPAVTLPAYVSLAFSASTVTIGGTVTTVTLESTASSAQTNIPFTFGHAFKQGDLAPGDFLTGRTSGLADVPLQVNVKATHFDGSVRHAVISGILPALSGNAVRSLALVRVASNPVGASAEASSALTSAGFTASLALAIGGVTYTASPNAALAAGMAPSTVWIGGAVATEWSVMLPLLDASNNPHPLLTAQFNIRYYPGTACAKVDVTIENTKAYEATTDVAYDATLTVGGAVAYTYPGVTHYVATRFYRSAWWGTQPALHIRHDRAYLTATKQVPNYDLSVVMDEATLNSWSTLVSDTTKFGPMGPGPYVPYMAATGGRPDIGLNPAWAAATVISMDQRAKALTLAGAACGGSWACHRRDTSAGPGNGYPLSVVNWPTSTVLGGAGDGVNYSTGQNEKFPNRPNTNPNTEDNAHTPNFSYLAYLLTGDLFYLEEILFYTTWVEYFENPFYRQHEKGVLDSVPMGQIRGQGWALRALAEASTITPDTHYLKPHFLYWTNNTLAAHNARLTDNPNANKLGINDTYFPYDMVATGVRTGQALWQDDHFTSAVGHASELGFTEAGRLLTWKAKFQIGRLLDPDWCYQDAALYNISVRSSESSPTFNTWAEVKAGTVGTWMEGRGYFDAATIAAPCGSQQRLDAMNASRAMPSDPIIPGQITGYAQYPDGFVANFQPAIAMAADSGYTDGDLAWMQFDSRTVKPDYGTSPQFAIVPRTTTATATPPAPQPTNRTAMSFDRVKTTTTSTGTGNMTVSASAATRYLPLSSIPTSTSVALVVEDENGTDWEESYCTVLSATTFSRDTVIKGSNGQNKVNFSAGTKTVFATLTADQINAFLTAGSLTGAPAVTTVADPTAVSLITNVGGVVKQITAANFIAALGVTTTNLPAAGTLVGADLLTITQSDGTEHKVSLTAIAAAVASINGGTAPAATVPGQVTGLAAGTATDTTQVLNWTAPSTGTAPFTYKVERSAAGANAWATVNASVSGTTYTVTGLTASTSYDYRVSAANSTGTGAVSTTLTTATIAAPVSVPGQVTGLAAGTATGATQDLTWTAVSGATSYKVEKSPAGANTWTTANASVSGTSYTVTGLSASTNYDYRVSGNNTAGTGTASATVTKSTTAAPAATITVNNPASPQTVGTPYTVSGTWTVTQPTAIDVLLTDNGTPGTWAAATTNLVINANGTWSFTATPTTASTSRTITARDHNATSVVSAPSSAYVVNAAAAPVYQFNGKAFTEMPTTASFGGADAAYISADFIIKTAAGVAPVDANVDIYAAMATSTTVMPRPNDAAHTGAPAGGPAWRTCGRIGAGNAAYDGNYSYSSLYTYKSFGGGLSPRYTWIMVFQKGADPATATPIWAAPYDGNHTGTPIAITVTA